MDVDNDNNDENTNNSNNSNTADESKSNADLRYDVELTRAIKENHGHKIVDARFCPFKGGEAFFATAGSNQIMIYDCEVRGNFISTLLNYRNWHLQTMRTKNIVWKENLEKNHLDELEKKSFNCLCWMRRYRDFWIAAADNEQQIHLLSLTFAKCIKIIKCQETIIDLISHPIYPNIICAIGESNKCRFINTTNEEIIYTLPDKICQIRFSPSGNKFCAVLTNGTVREYSQKVEMIDDADDDMKNADDYDDDEDDDLNHNNNKNTNNHNKNSNNNNKRSAPNKRLIVEKLNVHKFEEKGINISDIHYCGERVIIVGNENGEFKMVNMDNTQLLHQWKAIGPISKEGVCKFDVNADNNCVVYGNGTHQVQIYDLKKKKYLRKVDTGRGRKLPFSFAAFCRNHPQSVMMVCEDIVMKFDPLELVKDYFPSTADFAVQKRNGRNCFTTVKTVEYEADKIKN